MIVKMSMKVYFHNDAMGERYKTATSKRSCTVSKSAIFFNAVSQSVLSLNNLTENAAILKVKIFIKNMLYTIQNNMLNKVINVIEVKLSNSVFG